MFKPVAVKLERRTEQRIVLMKMVLQGISMMCAKRSPSLMRETLKSFVAHHEDEIFDGPQDMGKRTAKRTGASVQAAAKSAAARAAAKP